MDNQEEFPWLNEVTFFIHFILFLLLFFFYIQIEYFSSHELGRGKKERKNARETVTTIEQLNERWTQQSWEMEWSIHFH